MPSLRLSYVEKPSDPDIYRVPGGFGIPPSLTGRIAYIFRHPDARRDDGKPERSFVFG